MCALSMQIQMSKCCRGAKLDCWLVLLSEVVDGLEEAVEPGVAGHQHQEAHGDHLHCAG